MKNEEKLFLAIGDVNPEFLQALEDEVVAESTETATEITPAAVTGETTQTEGSEEQPEELKRLEEVKQPEPGTPQITLVKSQSQTDDSSRQSGRDRQSRWKRYFMTSQGRGVAITAAAAGLALVVGVGGYGILHRGQTGPGEKPEGSYASSWEGEYAAQPGGQVAEGSGSGEIIEDAPVPLGEYQGSGSLFGEEPEIHFAGTVLGDLALKEKSEPILPLRIELANEDAADDGAADDASAALSQLDVLRSVVFDFDNYMAEGELADYTPLVTDTYEITNGSDEDLKVRLQYPSETVLPDIVLDGREETWDALQELEIPAGETIELTLSMQLLPGVLIEDGSYCYELVTEEEDGTTFDAVQLEILQGSRVTASNLVDEGTGAGMEITDEFAAILTGAHKVWFTVE